METMQENQEAQQSQGTNNTELQGAKKNDKITLIVIAVVAVAIIFGAVRLFNSQKTYDYGGIGFNSPVSLTEDKNAPVPGFSIPDKDTYMTFVSKDKNIKIRVVYNSLTSQQAKGFSNISKQDMETVIRRTIPNVREVRRDGDIILANFSGSSADGIASGYFVFDAAREKMYMVAIHADGDTKKDQETVEDIYKSVTYMGNNLYKK